MILNTYENLQFLKTQFITMIVSYHIQSINVGVSIMAHREWIQLGTMRLRVWSLASLSGLRIWHCHVLWYRSQTQLRSCTAVAEASGCSSTLTPSLGISICCGCGPGKQNKFKKYFKNQSITVRCWFLFFFWEEIISFYAERLMPK